MEFSDEQKDKVREWAGEGAGLAEIQRRIGDEFGVSMTYMDVRFLVVDLDATIEDPEDKNPPAPQPEPDAVPPEAAAMPSPQSGAAGVGLAGNVSVEVDRLMKPGALVSGTVTFSDGVTATWMLDQLGRLGIDPSQPGYRPSEEDNAAFVEALKAEVTKKGL